MAPGATSGEPAVEARGLVVRYDRSGGVTALDGLDLEVARGAFFGLLGPNGAGKTTAIGVLTTWLAPSAGRARVLGRDVVAERAAVRRDVGLVFQESTLDPELSAREHLELFARLYHLAGARARVGEMLALVGLEAEADRAARLLSGGQKRRLEIARGLLHRPRVLFLDEPTLGLDVASRSAIWEHLRALHASGGTTIFLTTHSMEEADALCQEIAILDRGRRVVSGSPEALKSALGGDVVEIRLERGDGAQERLRCCAGVQQVALAGPSHLRITVHDGPRRLAALLEALSGLGVLEVHLRRPTLEHVFLHHTGHAFEALA
jgi:ABC-2 type transport system ATP-binding protein